MKNHRLAHICLCFITALLAVGCNRSENTAGNQGSSTAASKNFKLAFVTNNASDYWTIARKGVEKADAEMNNVTVEFKLPGEGTAAEQKRIIDDLVSTGIQGIAMSPVDPDNQTQLINDTSKKNCSSLRRIRTRRRATAHCISARITSPPVVRSGN